MTRYKMNFAIPGGEPLEALTVDDDNPQWVIVAGDDDAGEQRTESAQEALDFVLADQPDAEIADVLGQYFGMGSYTQTSAWTESPMDYNGTVERLKLELREWIDSVKVARRARLAEVSNAAYDAHVHHVGPEEDVPEERWEAFRQQVGPEPTVGKLSDERRAAAIAALEARIGGPVVVVVNEEEVFSEAEDVPSSEEGQ